MYSAPFEQLDAPVVFVQTCTSPTDAVETETARSALPSLLKSPLTTDEASAGSDEGDATLYTLAALSVPSLLRENSRTALPFVPVVSSAATARSRMRSRLKSPTPIPKITFQPLMLLEWRAKGRPVKLSQVRPPAQPPV